ncbi:hypothetical protein [Wenxinia marina]|uniref:Uncharacterized protein n=1 Tax=Wenxinia marina DSM 24838 TaxID=1123501 RepID=A0A0D0Q0A7_9RHOB|nr:hypothetical protein [Wenxinia marina]KIQ68029.1 hypothetical protein Wenmar_03485 [Wenxinia marina DSM 24838]GGL75281.1 hypothetical protein GCM10011392_32410 [Wenxinia marina]
MATKDEIGNAARDEADKVSAAARDTAHEIADAAKRTGRDAQAAVTDEVRRRGESAKSATADEIHTVSEALRKAARDLQDGSPQERTFGYLADNLATMSDTVRDKDIGEMVDDLSAFARRNPLMFLGASALVGFAVARFGRASRPEPELASPATRTQPGMTSAPYTPGAGPAKPSGTPGVTHGAA